jgi:hypothetical protein
MFRVRLYNWDKERLVYADKLFADLESAKDYAHRSHRHSAKIFTQLGQLVYHIMDEIEKEIETYA